MIVLKNIHKKYDGKVAIHDASCGFEKNKVTVILGPSGSGKTTLIRCINRLEHPDKGTVTFNETKIIEKNIAKIRQKVGMVFQSFNLFPHMSVLQNLTYAPENINKLNKIDLEKKALNLLGSLNIEDKKDFLPGKLSGGQKQRVAICRALMMDPEVMLFDEPTSALDPESVKDIVAILEDLRHKLTIIVVTHHVSFAKRIADQVIFMDQGHILTDQKSSEFFENPKSIRAKMYLDAVGEFG